MKVISPGVVALKPFKIHTTALTQEMVDFWVMMGAEAQEQDICWLLSRKGPVTAKNYRIRMGRGYWSHKFNDGSNNYLIHLREEFAPEASLFMLKFYEAIINHDCKVPDYDFS